LTPVAVNTGSSVASPVANTAAPSPTATPFGAS
jgi:hypothetical protein